MLWSWGVLLLCLSATAVNLKPEDSFTMACSTAGCIKNLDGISGVYLYRDHKKITYYDYDKTKKDGNFNSLNSQDVSRIVKTGSFEQHNITIMNMTVEDSGMYYCSFYTFRDKCNVQCNWTKVVVISEVPKYASPPEPTICPLPILIIVLTATVSIFTTMIFTLIIIPKVKDFLREPGDARPHSNNVYEVMTRNGFHSESGT